MSSKTSSNPSSDSPLSASQAAETKKVKPNPIPEEFQRIIESRHHDPFSVLGKHKLADATVIRAFVPTAKKIWVKGIDQPMQRLFNSDLFEVSLPIHDIPEHYELEWIDAFEQKHEIIDPYTFAPQLPDFDMHLFQEGKHWHIYRLLGAHIQSIDGIAGVLFAVWAPNATRVSVIGDFNLWDGRRHCMRNRGASGIWELFIPQLSVDCLYKFEIRGQHGENLDKTDPYAQSYEKRPKTACLVTDESPYAWQDKAWLEQRGQDDWLHQPISIYEVHLGSWRRAQNNQFLDYRHLAQQLVEYVKFMGYTHIQLLPITEHPLDASWGYQTTGYFAPTSRFGSPEDFKFFVDTCHQHNIGVLLDWVPAHFPKDEHALAKFDGSALYEHEDPRRGEHRDWGTYIYNYGRNEVKNFLLASAVFWLEEYHIDGLRVDAVASMLYLDYSREAGDWLPNVYGGNENLEAIDFLREFNSVIHGEFPGALVIAEESTAWPQVTRPTWLGGLGFSMKWNMGWMHDNLLYMSKDPIHRLYHHDQLTIGLLYAFTENFVLPLSHDEVVHGKGSMINKMPGDEWQRFANLRLLYTYMFTYPGKKLLFMGNDIGQGSEWNFDTQLDWYILDYAYHQGLQKAVRDLNHLYRDNNPLHAHDFDESGFEWVDCHDASQSIISYLRKNQDGFVLTILNFTPIPRHDYQIGVPASGHYVEVFNSDSSHYGGGNVGNLGAIESSPQIHMGRPHSIRLTLPPLGGIVLKLQHS